MLENTISTPNDTTIMCNPPSVIRECKFNDMCINVIDVKSAHTYVLSKLPNRINPIRIWVVADSVLTFNTLHRLFPNAELMIVQIGKKIRHNQFANIKYRLFISPIQFNDKRRTYVPDVYDNEVWNFVKTHGRNSDYMWDMAGMSDTHKITSMLYLMNDIVKHTGVKIDILSNALIDSEILLLRCKINDKLTMFKKLCEVAKEWVPSNMVVQLYPDDFDTHGGISNHHTELFRNDAVANRGFKLSMRNTWKKVMGSHRSRNAFARMVITSIGDNSNIDLRDVFAQVRGVGECNTFNPMVLVNFVKRYCVDPKKCTLLDPSMGWGDRLYAALALEVGTIIGFDPNTSVTEAYHNIVAENNCGSSSTVIIPEKFTVDRIPSEYVGVIDMAITSPPFFNMELYNGSEDDVKCTYDDWINNMYTQYLRDIYTAVKVGGYIGIYTDNVNSVGYIADDTRRILTNAGATYIECIKFRHNYKNARGVVNIGRIRSCLVFRK